MSRETLTVLVPCYNEESGVTETVGAILAEAPNLPLDVEIVMIDDGSTDGTRQVQEGLCAEHPQCRMIVNEKNLGLGRSVLNAYSDLDDDTWVTVVPGDNEFVFRSIRNHIAVREEYEVILGYFQNAVIRTFTRRGASFAFTRVVGLLYGFSYRYLNGFKMYRAGAFKGIEVVSGGHAFNAELLAKAILRKPDLSIGEVPFIARGRAQGSSKAFRPGSIWRALKDVLRGYRSVAAYRRQVIQEEG